MSIEYNATVVQRVDITPGLMILRVVPDQLPFEFQAGQYTVLGLKQGAPRATAPEGWARGPAPIGTSPALPASDADPERMIRRAYSVASSSRSDEFIEFYLALVPSGELTPRLFALKVHDRIYVGPKATGMFTLGKVPPDRHIYLVGTGTGLAPYMSMLRSEVRCGGPQKVIVLHGARVSWDLAYRTELMTLTHLCSNIRYFPVISIPEEDPTWRGLTGFLQDVLLAGEIEAATGVPVRPEHAHVFLCGNPLMIEGATTRLTAERAYKRDEKKLLGTLHLEEYW
jgi:ferredoxin--NADP+ reductase